MNKITLYFALCVIVVGVFVSNFSRSYWYPYYLQLKGKRTVADVIERYGKEATKRLLPYFNKSNIAFPPEKISLVAFKDQKLLELWAHEGQNSELIKKYPILATSGKMGPKLREGDKQVPEGIYKIEYFNPNSSYHLSMKLNYPSEFDLKYAKMEGRDSPGTNIFIHGKAVSIGCLAMGDAAIEELFILSAKVKNINVVISPSDPNSGKLIPPANAAKWVSELYQRIEVELSAIRT